MMRACVWRSMEKWGQKAFFFLFLLEHLWVLFWCSRGWGRAARAPEARTGKHRACTRTGCCTSRPPGASPARGTAAPRPNTRPASAALPPTSRPGPAVDFRGEGGGLGRAYPSGNIHMCSYFQRARLLPVRFERRNQRTPRETAREPKHGPRKWLGRCGHMDKAERVVTWPSPSLPSRCIKPGPRQPMACTSSFRSEAMSAAWHPGLPSTPGRIFCRSLSIAMR